MDELIRTRIRELTGGARETILASLGALIELHVRAETGHAASLPLFHDAVPRALSLLSHADDQVRVQASTLIAVMKLDPAGVVPRLTDELLRAHQEKWDYTYVIAQAVGAYGPAAASSVPALIHVLQSADYHTTVLFCALALAAIGPGAVAAVPAMEAARDRMTFSTKSDGKQFKTQMNQAIRSLQRCARPPKPAPQRSERQAYLMDLIGRLASRDHGIGSSATSISSKARHEAGNLRDPELIAELGGLLKGRLTVSHLSQAAVVLGFLTRNTESEAGRKLILELLERPDLPDRVVQTTIYAATHGEVRDAIPVIRQLLRAGNIHALTFVEELKLEECVDDVVEYTKATPGSVLLGIFALGKIGSPKAIPFLMEYATREFTSRKSEEREWRFYAINTIGTLGDRSVVPGLIELLGKFEDSEAPIIDALCKLSDARADAAVLNALTRLVESGARAERWSEGYRTPIVNALDLLKKTGRHRDADVVSLVDRLSEGQSWARLSPEEQSFVRDYLSS